MKFKFKKQQYQTAAVIAVTDCFKHAVIYNSRYSYHMWYRFDFINQQVSQLYATFAVAAAVLSIFKPCNVTFW